MAPSALSSIKSRILHSRSLVRSALPSVLLDTPSSSLRFFSSPSSTHVLLDCDGVLFCDTTPLPGSKEVVAEFGRMGKRVLFVTNGSSKSR